MKNCKRLIANVTEVLIGICLVVCAFVGLVDEFWSGMGTALIAVGGIMLIRNIRYRTNETYREAVDVKENDERNKYIAMKAWSWAGYIFVLVAAVATVVLKILHYETLMMAASGSVCLVLILYWGSYMCLQIKY